jgi:hypothetical protein
VTGLGADKVENLSGAPISDLPGSAGGRAASIGVGPEGQVITIWETVGPVDPQGIHAGPETIYASLDPDGLGPEPFGARVEVATSFMGGAGTLAAIPGGKTSIEANLAWDRSGGAYDGRVYVVYAEVAPVAGGGALDFNDLEILITHSDDDGETWSEPVPVHDDASSAVSRFFPSIAVDQNTGIVAAGWYDTQDDPGGIVRTHFYVAASNDGGKTFHANAASLGLSDATHPDLNGYGKGFNYGDYSFVVFDSTGRLIPIWADNSPLLAEVPDRPQFEVAIAEIGIIKVDLPPPVILPVAVRTTEDAAFNGQVAFLQVRNPPRKADEFEVSIDWGDGSSSPGTVIPIGSKGRSFEIHGSHVYADEGAYLVWLTVTDKTAGRDYHSINNFSEAETSDAEVTVAVDPTNPLHAFAASVSIGAGGIRVAVSTSGGASWDGSVLGDGSDGLPSACCDPQVAFDEFGNLFLVSLDESSPRKVVLLMSTDGGATFTHVRSFDINGQGLDYPNIATGPGPGGAGRQVAIMYEADSPDGSTQQIAFAHALVSGPGQVGPFTEGLVNGSFDGKSRNFGDVAIGPKGEILVVYGSNQDGDDAKGVYAHLDPDGAGPLPYGPAIRGADTRLYPRIFGFAPAQSVRGITHQGNLAWDRSGGSFHGRVYLSYTDTSTLDASDTDVYLVFSDDQGRSWHGGHLFRLGLEFREPLDIGDLTVPLKAEFLENGVPLNDGAAVVEATVGQFWRIFDGQERYLVRFNPEVNQLDVFRERNRVHPGETAGSSELFPSIALDQSTGYVTVGWYSSAGDPGDDELRFRVAISTDGGSSFSEPRIVSPGWSDADQPEMAADARNFQFGEYTGVSLVGGVIVAVWAENSPELEENPVQSSMENVSGVIGVAHVAGVPFTAKATNASFIEGRFDRREVATFIDPDPDGAQLGDYDATIEWGDNSESSRGFIERDGLGYRVDGRHRYHEDGVYVVTVTIRGRSTSSVVQGVADVVNATLTPVPLEIRVVEDVPFAAVIGGFTDANPTGEAGDFTASIDWGDGSAPSIGTIELSGIVGSVLHYQVSGAHGYADEDSYPVLISVTETGSETFVIASTVIAGDPPALVVGQAPVAIGALEGVPTGPLALAVFEVQGPLDVQAGAYTVEIDWDDGTKSFLPNPQFVANQLTVTASHVFQTGGLLAPQVILHDDSGGAYTAAVVADVGRDITADVNPSSTGVVLNPSTGHYTGGITVLNNSTTSFTGPFLIVIEGLSGGVGLLTQDGETPAGDPYLEAAANLLFAGASLPAVPIEFDAAPGSYAVRVYAGADRFGVLPEGGGAADRRTLPRAAPATSSMSSLARSPSPR